MKHAARKSSVEMDEGCPQPDPAIEARVLSTPASPARLLQNRLHASLADEPVVDRWPIAVRTGFITLSAASLWLVPIALVSLIRQLAA